ncbi:putative glucosidase [Escherichia coli]|uniref:Putative glucosidase n=1 Tax=Escherichia coli TaxID=562 RepID=A0A377AVK3_ECOLX|nr:putative glucosidase [Escherichia coli]
MYGCQITKLGWYDFYNGEWFSGGQWITLDAPLEKLPLMVRAGAGLPLSKRITYVSAEQDDTRELKLFPLKGVGTTSGLLFEDDGESWGYQTGNALWVEWEMVCDGATINLKVNARGDYRPAWSALKVSLPLEENARCWSMVLKGVNGCVKSLPGREATAPYPVQPSNPLPQYFTLQEGSKPVNPGASISSDRGEQVKPMHLPHEDGGELTVDPLLRR